MLECYSTNATAAKIRAIHGHMFTADNYRELMLRRSIPEAAEYLARSNRFKDVFREVDPGTVHRGFLEELLYKQNFNTYMRLCGFQGLDKLPFYNFLIRKREVESILSIINSINSSLENPSPSDIPGYVINHSQINLLEISRSESFADLLKILKGTSYYRTLVKVPLMEDGSADYTECERRLRNEYFSEILTQIKESFAKSDAQELTDMILAEIDGRNIINAYRMKAFFGFSPEDIMRRSLKFTKLGKNRMEKFYSSESAEQMLEWIDRSVCHGNCEDTDNIEVKVNRVKARRLSSKIARSSSTAVVMYAFIQLCEIEVGNIIHIIEGIRYGAEPALIQSQLVIS